MNASLKRKIKKVKMLILDVDGVLTDGTINFNDRGGEIKKFDVQDGFGLVLFKRMGNRTAIITARGTPAVRARAKDLKIDKVYQDAYPKVDYYERLLREFKLKDEQACFVGDDLPDLGVLKRVGFAVSVPNAVKEVKAEADYITKKHGGRGAVREVIELILKEQGKWKKILQQIK